MSVLTKTFPTPIFEDPPHGMHVFTRELIPCYLCVWGLCCIYYSCLSRAAETTSITTQVGEPDKVCVCVHIRYKVACMHVAYFYDIHEHN